MNKISLLIVFLFLGFIGSLSAQDGIVEVAVSKDTVLMGNAVRVSFIASNVSGKFTPPTFEGFDIISGPSTSSSYSFMNGTESRKTTYNYILSPIKEGSLFIGSAKFASTEETKTTNEIEVFVKPNPTGIRENVEGKDGLDDEDFFKGFGSLKDFFNMDDTPYSRPIPESQPPVRKTEPYKFKTEKL